MFLNTPTGLAVGGMVGAGSGALSGSLVGYGIDAGFIRSIGETLKPETSALFLPRKSLPEKVLAELSEFKKRVIRSSLSPNRNESSRRPFN